jgi:hypothetical protein
MPVLFDLANLPRATSVRNTAFYLLQLFPTEFKPILVTPVRINIFLVYLSDVVHLHKRVNAADTKIMGIRKLVKSSELDCAKSIIYFANHEPTTEVPCG